MQENDDKAPGRPLVPPFGEVDHCSGGGQARKPRLCHRAPELRYEQQFSPTSAWPRSSWFQASSSPGFTPFPKSSTKRWHVFTWTGSAFRYQPLRKNRPNTSVFRSKARTNPNTTATDRDKKRAVRNGQPFFASVFAVSAFGTIPRIRSNRMIRINPCPLRRTCCRSLSRISRR